MSEQPEFVINATYRLHPDDVSAFRERAVEMVRVSRLRDGCTFFDIMQDVTDPATFRLVEGWTSRAALDAHFASAPFQALLGEMLRLRVLDRHADAIFVSRVEALPMPMPSA